MIATDVGRGCDNETAALAPGMDFRRPQYRREAFLRFYEHHLRWRSHPGCVYYLLDAIAADSRLDTEQRLWLTAINGNTQHPVTSTILLRRFPRPDPACLPAMEDFFNRNYARLPFDTDRRHHKKMLIASLRSYLKLVDGDAAGYWQAASGDGFAGTWKAATAIHSFGRLSAFSFLEYAKIMGHGVDCDDLLLRDMDGSKSHRNGLARVLGRDELDWHASTGFDGKYTERVLYWLEQEAALLLDEAQGRRPVWTPVADGIDSAHVGNFTLESALCAFKQFFRGRRYPNIYQDMAVDRIRNVQRLWPDEDLSLFWNARAALLPDALRVEVTGPQWGDPGVHPIKQGWFRFNGQLVNMDVDDPTFVNSFRRTVMTAKREDKLAHR